MHKKVNIIYFKKKGNTSHRFDIANHIFFSYSWILRLFYSADKNHSNTLTRRECRDLLEKNLNLEIPANEFKDIFNVILFFDYAFIYNT